MEGFSSSSSLAASLPGPQPREAGTARLTAPTSCKRGAHHARATCWFAWLYVAIVLDAWLRSVFRVATAKGVCAGLRRGNVR